MRREVDRANRQGGTDKAAREHQLQQRFSSGSSAALRISSSHHQNSTFACPHRCSHLRKEPHKLHALYGLQKSLATAHGFQCWALVSAVSSFRWIELSWWGNRVCVFSASLASDWDYSSQLLIWRIGLFWEYVEDDGGQFWGLAIVLCSSSIALLLLLFRMEPAFCGSPKTSCDCDSFAIDELAGWFPNFWFFECFNYYFSWCRSPLGVRACEVEIMPFGNCFRNLILCLMCQFRIQGYLEGSETVLTCKLSN